MNKLVQCLRPWAVFVMAAFLAVAAAAQPYPSRPITIVVPFAAGGGPDIVGRRIASKLSASMGVPVVIANRDGAGGRIGTGSVARAAPDGYTLLLGTSSALVLAPALYKDLPYDSGKSFAPVSLVVHGPMVLSVRSSLPVTDVRSLLAYASANPGRLNYGSAGVGSVHHLSGELLQRSAGFRMTHIPYKGGALAWNALSAGEVDLVIDAMFGGAAPALSGGKARAIAVTGPERLGALPAVPTLEEQGIRGMDVSFWWGFLVPAQTPAAIVSRLNREIVAAMSDPELKASFAVLSLDLRSSTSDEFSTLIASDLKRWRAAVVAADIKPE